MTFGELKAAIEHDFAATNPKNINGYYLSKCVKKALGDELEGFPYDVTVEAKYSHKTVLKFMQKKPFSADIPLISGRLPGSISYDREKTDGNTKYVVSIQDYDKELYPDILSVNVADFLLVETQRLEYTILEKKLKELTLYMDMIHLAQEHGFDALGPMRTLLQTGNEPKLSLYCGEGEHTNRYEIRIPFSMADEISATFSDATMKEIGPRLVIPTGWDGSAAVQRIMDTMEACKAELTTRKSGCRVKEAADNDESLYYLSSPACGIHIALNQLKLEMGNDVVVDRDSSRGVLIRSLFSEEFLDREASFSTIEEIQAEEGTCYWAILDKDTMKLSFGKGQSGKEVPIIGSHSVAIVTSTSY